MSMNFLPGGSGAISGPGRRAAAAPAQGPDMSQYLEEFHKSVQYIPAELQRQLKLLRQLDERVAEMRDKISTDCAAYSAAKSKDTPEMQALKQRIDATQKECLDTADEKINLVTNLYTQLEAKMRELDDKMTFFDEAMMQQDQMQAAEEAEDDGGERKAGRGEKRRHRGSAAGMSQAAAAAPVPGERDPYGWVQKGVKVEVKWGEDWWQATVKKVETRGGGTGALAGPGRAAMISRVLIGYEGGEENEDEWIEVKSGRLREPQADFHEEPLDLLGIPPTPLTGGRFRF